MNARLLTVLVLLFAVIGSALGLVYTRHENRRAAIALDELENQRDNAIAEWSRLQLEQAWLADAGQVERKAEEQLGMTPPAEVHILEVRP